MTEIANILDLDGNVIGKMSRDEAEASGHITENVLVFIFDSLGRVWTQLRSKDKKTYPGLIDVSTCGGKHSHETKEGAANREVAEETGLLSLNLKFAETFLNSWKDASGTQHQVWSHLFTAITDDTPEAQPKEGVDEYQLWSDGELIKALAEAPQKFIPSFAAEYRRARNYVAKTVNADDCKNLK